MSATSGAVKNMQSLATIAGLTEAQARKLSGADLMRAALLAKAGLDATTGATYDGSRLYKAANGMTI